MAADNSLAAQIHALSCLATIAPITAQVVDYLALPSLIFVRYVHYGTSASHLPKFPCGIGDNLSRRARVVKSVDSCLCLPMLRSPRGFGGQKMKHSRWQLYRAGTYEYDNAYCENNNLETTRDSFRFSTRIHQPFRIRVHLLLDQ